MEKLIDVREVAKVLGVSTRKVWAMRDAGYMPMPVKLGGSVRWLESALSEWLRNGAPDCRKMKGGQYGR
ncbi:MAG: Helix-turn-helix domain protein [Candidatus Hydrogenedentes bacterium ADurb.Bin179]|nr:MAG: Helix-turn-helix domain protein [Candidatus Hydrogenedentes bacterium ADurb.Bin179]